MRTKPTEVPKHEAILQADFERSREGRRAYDLPALDVPAANCAIPENMRAESKLDLPELGEVDLVRHYTNLSRRNFGVDNGFYPLGSCTMKYNPKINEEVAQLFNDVHPLLDADMCQGSLRLMYDMENACAKSAAWTLSRSSPLPVRTVN